MGPIREWLARVVRSGKSVILKERNAADHDDRGSRAAAGAKAELQMAHYLHRAFHANDGIAVINDLRVPNPDCAGDFAQVDHLLIHRFGLIVIESKSVSDRVTVLPDGQWIRGTLASGQGMPSPVQQAQRQAEMLRRVLSARFDPLGVGVFARVSIEALVAISDHGILDRGSSEVGEACKADQVVDRVVAIVRRLAAGPKQFDAAKRKQIAEHLLAIYVPLRGSARRPAVEPKPAKPSEPVRPAHVAEPKCKHCGSGALHAQYGRYGYFFRCLSCTGNTKMSRACPSCGADLQRVRKDRLNFFVDCDRCRRTTRVYTNASLADLEGPDDVG